ncbi:MAG: hypothetical protein AUH85_15835 [Chloroflexi bacterium 13_1_40CM_4_68_4]|nr:MAG: hypothetical protein AUH85_15835 [Chloroflexi bacterium 13_1_40CM_4_68_4]
MAKELTISLPNKPGQLALLADTLGKAGVNITALSASTTGPKGVIRVVADEPGKAKRALKSAKIRVTGERDVLEVRLRNKPGALARVAKRLGKAKVNIDSAYLLAADRKRAVAAIGVKNMRAAKKALGR